MKKIRLNWAIFFFLLSLSLYACKDDEESSPKNQLKVGSETYTLADGFLENFGADDASGDAWDYDGYNLDLILLSEGINLASDGSVTGSGQAMYFELVSSSATELANDTYTYNSQSPSTTGTIFSSYYLKDFDLANFTATQINITSATLTVEKDGGIYNLSFEGASADGNAISGDFSGDLPIIEDNSERTSRNIKRKFNK